ncbi:MAG: hypothetical protein IGQ45_13925 [Cyanobacterium sp. T60_A2020_053]|nr:hypothetical protein [Cyanobacterium sp. T60_A2020_053]
MMFLEKMICLYGKLKLKFNQYLIELEEKSSQIFDDDLPTVADLGGIGKGSTQILPGFGRVKVVTVNLFDQADIQDDVTSLLAVKTIENYLTWETTLAGLEQTYYEVWEKTNKKNPRSQYYPLNSSQQRQWAVNVDSYSWNLRLIKQGYWREGLQGMLENNWQIIAKETTARLLEKRFFIK